MSVIKKDISDHIYQLIHSSLWFYGSGFGCQNSSKMTTFRPKMRILWHKANSLEQSNSQNAWSWNCPETLLSKSQKRRYMLFFIIQVCESLNFSNPPKTFLSTENCKACLTQVHVLFLLPCICIAWIFSSYEINHNQCIALKQSKIWPYHVSATKTITLIPSWPILKIFDAHQGINSRVAFYWNTLLILGYEGMCNCKDCCFEIKLIIDMSEKLSFLFQWYDDSTLHITLFYFRIQNRCEISQAVNVQLNLQEETMH